MNVALFGALGILAIIGVVALYFGRGAPIPSSLEEWASFGTYVAGLAGPLLSFVALLAVARTLHLQRESLDLDREKQLADQHLRWLETIYADITYDLDKRVSPDATLREIVEGDQGPDSVDQKRLQRRLEDLLRLVAQYCRAVDMYRDNVSEFYDLQIYQDRGGRLLDALKPLHKRIGGQVLPTFEFCDMHLRGESERALPEAMKRSSRGY